MNILVTGAWRQAEENLNDIINMGNDVLFMKNEKDNLPCDPALVEGIICSSVFFMHHVIEDFTNLIYVQVTSAGMDTLPLDYIEAHNIELFNAKGVYSIPMAEYVLGSVLSIYKGTYAFYENQKNHKWSKNYGLAELNDKRVCIIGCGDVGEECAKRFKAFGCNVVGINRTVFRNENFDEIKSLSCLNDEIAKADITVICIALTKDTENLLNHNNLNYIKNNSIFINISRGRVVNTGELVKIIKDKRIKVVLDVFENEPLDSNSVLWGLDGVCITPHISFVGDHNNIRLKNVIITNLKNYLNLQ